MRIERNHRFWKLIEDLENGRLFVCPKCNRVLRLHEIPAHLRFAHRLNDKRVDDEAEIHEIKMPAILNFEQHIEMEETKEGVRVKAGSKEYFFERVVSRYERGNKVLGRAIL